ARARENARRASCQSNLKQIGLGFKMCSQDYDERMTLVVVTPKTGWNAFVTSDATPSGWADALQPYIKSTAILQCPSEEFKSKTGSGDFAGKPDPSRPGYTDYWM